MRPTLLVEPGDHCRIGSPQRITDGLVLVDGGLWRLIGRMGRERGEIEEERLFAILLIDQSDRIVANQIGVVALFPEEDAVALPVDHAAALAGEVIHLADHIAVEIVEASVLRPVFSVGMAKVPLADHQRLVADLLQGLRKRPLVQRQTVCVARENDERLEPVTHRVAAGHQRGP